jgi:hypothetical protein
VNPAALPAFFAAHKAAVLGGGAAAVAGLALYQRKKGTTAGGAAATTAGARVPGTIPAAAVEPQSVGAYDSTSFDLYNALSGQLEQIAQTGTSSGAAQASGPVASTLFNPTGSGDYVRGSNGMIAEVESDGSLFALTRPQWQQLEKNAGGKVNVTNMAQLPASLFSTAKNVVAKNPA